MVSRDSFRRIYFFVFNVAMIILVYYLTVANLLSYSQSYMLYFGALGAFAVVDFLLLNPKIDSAFKENRIFVGFPLVLGIALLTSLLITSSIDSSVSVLILVAVDFSLVGVFGVIEWRSKRERKNDLPVENQDAF
jgi:hypothetical protein